MPRSLLCFASLIGFNLIAFIGQTDAAPIPEPDVLFRVEVTGAQAADAAYLETINGERIDEAALLGGVAVLRMPIAYKNNGQELPIGTSTVPSTMRIGVGRAEVTRVVGPLQGRVTAAERGTIYYVGPFRYSDTPRPDTVLEQRTAPGAGGTVTPTAVRSATPSPSVTPSRMVTFGTPSTPTVTPEPIPCVGDCSGESTVTVDEILAGITIALGTSSSGVDGCPAFDSNGDRQVTVDEILTAVDNALNGCGRP